jgi:hypothetical protein
MTDSPPSFRVCENSTGMGCHHQALHRIKKKALKRKDNLKIAQMWKVDILVFFLV